MDLCLMIEGQEGVTWPQWLALAQACESSGTLVSPVTFRHPSDVAKVVVAADHVSGGRVELGLGAGWHEREHAAYGYEFPPLKVRMDRLAEQLEIVHGHWADGSFSFAGEHYVLEDLDARPKPVQRPLTADLRDSPVPSAARTSTRARSRKDRTSSSGRGPCASTGTARFPCASRARAAADQVRRDPRGPPRHATQPVRPAQALLDPPRPLDHGEDRAAGGSASRRPAAQGEGACALGGAGSARPKRRRCGRCRRDAGKARSAMERTAIRVLLLTLSRKRTATTGPASACRSASAGRAG